MRHELRKYQQRAVDRLIDALRQRPVLVAPTGSGKTVMATEAVQRIERPTLWLAHRKELIEQAAKRLEAHGLPCGIVMGARPSNPLAPVQVASVATLARRAPARWPDAGLIVIDECHRSLANTYRQVLDAYPGADVAGLTATPFRLDGRGLGDLFGELVVAAYTDELCEQGFLHAPKVWASHSPDLRGVKMLAGDYGVGALAKRANTHQLNGDIVQTWLKRAAGRRTVAFAVDVEHSIAIRDAFLRAGVAAEHLDGSLPEDERDGVLDRLASG